MSSSLAPAPAPLRVSRTLPGPIRSSRWRGLTVLLASALVLAACALEDWQQSCPGERFCFEHPTFLTQVDTETLGALAVLAGKMEGKGLTLFYEIGKEASAFAELKDAPMEPVTVGDHQGQLINATGRNGLMALAIPLPEPAARFSMLVHSTGALDLEMARRILTSVRIHAP